MTHAPPHIILIGAGPVGLATALWLLKDTPWRVTLLDAQTPEAAQHDPRALALSWGSHALLTSLGAWPQAATPIKHIHVSQRGHLGRAVIRHDEHGIPALGYVVRYGDVVASLAQALRTQAALPALRARFTWLTEHQVTSAAAQTGLVSAQAKDGTVQNLQADLIVSAEGGFFHTQASKGRQRDYAQVGLISTVTCSQAQVGWAWERFTHEGPLALLPHALPHNHPTPHAPAWALVWCGTPENSAARMALDDAAFLQALGDAFGGRMGHFTWADKRACFPLGLNATETLVQDKMVAIGNAAQTLHPVAGQGLNLGLRDAFCLVQAVRADLSVHALAQFSQSRQADRQATIGLTDTLARGFTDSFAADFAFLPGSQTALGHLRGAALLAVDVLSPLKKALARQMLFGRR